MANLTDIINVETFDILTQMESYRGKISMDIDNVIDFQTKRNMSTIIRKYPSKFDSEINDHFDYASINFDGYNHLTIQQALYK